MSGRRLALVIGLFLSSTACCLAAQAIRQEEGKPLLPPNLMFAGEPSGGGTTVIGFNIAPVPSIPFTGVIETENQVTDAKGNNTFHHHTTKIARDMKGRTRIAVDLHSINTPSDPKLVTVYIYDAVTKADLTVFPWRQLAMRYEDKPLPQPVRGKRPAPIALEPDDLGLGQQVPIDIQREELGAEVIQGMQLRHGRETSRYPAGFAGRKEAYTVVTDYWYSQELQSFVLVKQVGPLDNVQTLTLRNVRHENPDRSLFTIPKGYKVQ